MFASLSRALLNTLCSKTVRRDSYRMLAFLSNLRRMGICRTRLSAKVYSRAEDFV